MFQDGLDLPQNIIKYAEIIGTKNIFLKSTPVRKHTRMRLYKTLEWPIPCHGSETWTVRKGDKTKITACEIKFMKRTVEYTKWDHIRNEDILKVLKI
jgi:hypothetical protein